MNIKRFYLENKEYFAPVFAIALPTIADMFVQTLLGFSDMVMVGRIGPEAINDVGIGNVPILFITTIFFALATGTTAIMSRAYGTSSKSEGTKIASQTLFITLPISIFIMLFMLFFADGIINFVSGNGDLKGVRDYYIPAILGVPFLAINVIFAGLYRAVGYAKVPMITNILSVVSNVILNWIFIFELHLGVFGAAIATTASRVLVTGVYCYLVFKKKNFWVTLPYYNFKYNHEIASRILRIGVPTMLEQGLFRVGMIIFEMLVIRLGTISYAAHKIALTAESFSFNLGFGFAVASTSLVGQQLGKGDLDKAKKYAEICTILAMLVMTIFGLLFFIFPTLIIRVFTDSKEIQPLASSALKIVSICQPFLAASMVLSGSLRGAGATKAVLITTSLGMYLIRVPMTYTLLHIFNFGLSAAWVVMSFDLSFRCIANYIVFKNGKWKYIKV